MNHNVSLNTPLSTWPATTKTTKTFQNTTAEQNEFCQHQPHGHELRTVLFWIPALLAIVSDFSSTKFFGLTEKCSNLNKVCALFLCLCLLVAKTNLGGFPFVGAMVRCAACHLPFSSFGVVERDCQTPMTPPSLRSQASFSSLVQVWVVDVGHLHFPGAACGAKGRKFGLPGIDLSPQTSLVGGRRTASGTAHPSGVHCDVCLCV